MHLPSTLALTIKNQFTPVHTSFLLTIDFSFVSMRSARIMNMHQPVRYSRQGEDSIIIYRQSGQIFIGRGIQLNLSEKSNEVEYNAFISILFFSQRLIRQMTEPQAHFLISSLLATFIALRQAGWNIPICRNKIL